MEFSRQEYWNGQPFSSPGDLPNPGIKAGSSALQTDSLPSGKVSTRNKAQKALFLFHTTLFGMFLPLSLFRQKWSVPHAKLSPLHSALVSLIYLSRVWTLGRVE